eukprot:14552971-Alexandrium_andersonii.AAC.1
MRPETASWAPSAKVRWEVSTPTSLPGKKAWRSSRILTARATVARNSATLRPCSSGAAWGP